MRNNLYQILKCVVKEMDTDKVVSTYYSVGRYEKWFFNLFGPYVWRESDNLYYRKYGYLPTLTNVCHFSSYDEAVEICNEFNKSLKDQLVEKYVENKIVYDGRNIDEK